MKLSKELIKSLKYTSTREELVLKVVVTGICLNLNMEFKELCKRKNYSNLVEFIKKFDSIPQWRYEESPIKRFKKVYFEETGKVFPTKEYYFIVGRNKKVILQLDLQDNLIKEFTNATEAVLEVDSNITNIHLCCKGIYRQVKGFKWKYKYG